MGEWVSECVSEWMCVCVCDNVLTTIIPEGVVRPRGGCHGWHRHELKGAQVQRRTGTRAWVRARGRGRARAGIGVVVVVVVVVVDHELEHGAEGSYGRGEGSARVQHLTGVRGCVK